MDSIINQLSEIEQAASDIIAGTETQKKELEKENQRAMDEFDAALNKKTQEKVDAIRADLEEKMTAELSGRQQNVDDAIAALQNEYNTRHTEYAKQLVKQITEV